MPDEELLSTEPVVKPPFVLVATPTFTGHTAYEHTGSMEQFATLCAQHGIRFGHVFHPGLQFVEVARNLLIVKFLSDHPDATDLFYIDDDVGFPAMKALEFVLRQEPVVAGIPIMKADGPEQFPVFLHANEGGPIAQNGLMLARSVPCSFLRIKREVIEMLAMNAETYQWSTLEDQQTTVVFKIFDRGDTDGEFLGEDVRFCRLLADNGIPIWVDDDIKFSHRGTKRWSGSFRDALNLYLVGKSEVAKVRVMK
jgi:hypothetical protein